MSRSLEEVQNAFDKALSEYRPNHGQFEQSPKIDPIKIDPVFGWILLITALATILVVVIVLIVKSVDKNRAKMKVKKDEVLAPEVAIDPVKIVGDELLPISHLLVDTIKACVERGLSLDYESNTLKELDRPIKEFLTQLGLGADLGLYDLLVYQFLRARFRGDEIRPDDFEKLSADVRGLVARIKGAA